MTWNIAPVQAGQNKKGNTSRQKYKGSAGGSFAEALGAARRQRKDGGEGDLRDLYRRHKEEEARNLWRHVQQVNREVARMLHEGQDPSLRSG